MFAWHLTADMAEYFFEVCNEVGAKTEAERTEVLMMMARLGMVKNLTKTPLSKEDYIKHLSKNFDVGVVNSNGSIESIKFDDQPKEDNPNGTNPE